MWYRWHLRLLSEVGCVAIVTGFSFLFLEKKEHNLATAISQGPLKTDNDRVKSQVKAKVISAQTMYPEDKN